MKLRNILTASAAGLFVALALVRCMPATKGNADTETPVLKEDPVKRGEYLVTITGCDDCHSPKVFLPDGTPIPDSSRRLSGHPAGTKMPPFDASDVAPGHWYLGGSDMTYWVGPWGISYAANLTPDKATGTGGWTEDLFIRILRTGKHMGIESGRPILPPMPWFNYAKMTDEDLKAIFAYLQTLPPVSNQVPQPVPPTELAGLK